MAYDQNVVNTVFEQEKRRDPNLTTAQLVTAAGGYGVDPSSVYKASDAYDTKLNTLRGNVNGKSADEIFGMASGGNLSASDVGQVFNTSGNRVTELSGYDGKNWNQDATKDWWYDTGKGGWYQKKPPPQTGFNLSDLQSATHWDVTPNQTVAGQLDKLLAAGSPLLTQARTRALQAENMNGRLNTTMAAQAADAAVYDKALDIATPDAAVNAQAAQFNAGTDNTFARDANTFTREGVMADFNVRANDWAAQQAAAREIDGRLALMGVEQRNLLDRDAQQAGFQNARDALLHGYNLAEIDRRGLYGNTATVNTEPSYFDKLAAQDSSQTKRDASTRLYGAQTAFADRMFQIGTSSLGEDAKRDAIIAAQSNYNAIIRTAATELGWDPESYIIKGDFATPTAASSGASAAGGTSGTDNTGAGA